MTKHHITQLKVSMRSINQALTLLQISVLTMGSNKAHFILISSFYLDCPIPIRHIRDKVTIMFWLDDSIYDFFNIMHKILRLDCLTIERNIIMNHMKFFWAFFLRKKPTLTPPIIQRPNNNAGFLHFWKNAVTKLTFFLFIMRNFGIEWISIWLEINKILDKINRFDVSQRFSKIFLPSLQ